MRLLILKLDEVKELKEAGKVTFKRFFDVQIAEDEQVLGHDGRLWHFTNHDVKAPFIAGEEVRIREPFYAFIDGNPCQGKVPDNAEIVYQADEFLSTETPRPILQLPVSKIRFQVVVEDIQPICNGIWEWEITIALD